MKRISWCLVLFLLAAAVHGEVVITCTVDVNEVTIGYDASSEAPNLVRIFTLDVALDEQSGAVIEKFEDLSTDYWLHPGSVVIDQEGNVTDLGSAIADRNRFTPGTRGYEGTLAGVGTNGITVEMAALYEEDEPPPPAAGVLFKFSVDKTCDITVSENAVRRGVVMEDPDLQITVNSPGVGGTPVCHVSLDCDLDGVLDHEDNCVCTYNPGQEDADDDGVGDVCDNCRQVQNPDQADMGEDCPAPPYAEDPQCGDACDDDIDGDGILQDGDNSGVAGDNKCRGGNTVNCDDNCPINYNPEQEDLDNDAAGDICDNCPVQENEGQEDVDEDGVGDVCDNCEAESNTEQEDVDSDGVGDVCDNCLNASNFDQADMDADCLAVPPYSEDPHCGDVCDNCPGDYNPDQADRDGDETGDVCDQCPDDPEKIEPGICGCGRADVDNDGDGIINCYDNCPEDYNPHQEDMDGDCPAEPPYAEDTRCGDACDIDKDGDGILQDGDHSGVEGDKPCCAGSGINCDDNCPEVWNRDQADKNGDCLGDACECICDGDMNRDGWLSPLDLNAMVSELLPYESNAYYRVAPVNTCGDIAAPFGWLSPEDLNKLVNELLPYADNMYWKPCQ